MSRHRELLTILLFVAGVLLGAALLSPLLFAGAQGLLHYGEQHDWAHRSVLSGFLAVLQKNSFPSYFDRSALIIALAGLAPLLRHLRIEWSLVLGQVGPRNGVAQLGVGFALAVGFLFLMGALCWQYGIYHWQKNSHLSPGGPLLSGFAVAALEEFLFRGVMLGILLRSLGPRGAVFWTTVIFAALHFLKPPGHDALAAEDVHWWSGFWIIPQLFRGFGEWHDLVGEFLLLAGVGWTLARARLATGGLWAGIGLHAGWVAGMKSFGQITTTSKAFHEGAFFPWFVENHCKAIVSPFVGIAPLLAILVTGVCMLLLARWLSVPKLGLKSRLLLQILGIPALLLLLVIGYFRVPCLLWKFFDQVGYKQLVLDAEYVTHDGDSHFAITMRNRTPLNISTIMTSQCSWMTFYFYTADGREFQALDKGSWGYLIAASYGDGGDSLPRWQSRRWEIPASDIHLSSKPNLYHGETLVRFRVEPFDGSITPFCGNELSLVSNSVGLPKGFSIPEERL